MTPSSTAYLLIESHQGRQYIPLVGGSTWGIGRSDRNTIVLADPWVSRNHAMVQRLETGEYYFIDFGSRNGSFVNGRRVSIPVLLQDGDRMTVGETPIVFHQQLTLGTLGPTEPLEEGDGETATAVLHVRCLISVLVVDIRDFTPLARQVDEALLSQAIGSWFRQVGEIIQRFGSRVDKYIGDAVMAVWIHGTQGPNRQDLLRLLRALWAIEKTTSNLHYQYPLPHPLRIGAGINTGYAMVGNTGSGDRQEYTALGDTVNTAFRLESATKSLGLDVVLGEATFAHLHHLPGLEDAFDPHTLLLKGHDQPSTVWGTTFTQLKEFLLPRTQESDTRR